MVTADLNDFISVACDLCGSQDATVLFVKEGFSHVRCTACGMVFVNPRLARHARFQEQSGTGNMGEALLSQSQVKRLRREVQVFEPYRRTGRLLEIGTGRGWFVREAIRQGWRTWAVEINAGALECLRGIGLERIIDQPAESFEVPASYVDGVRLWDVIEHLESPFSAMRRIHGALRPGGLLRLSTTNFRSLSRWVNGPEWVYLNGADHIHLFDPATMGRLLTRAGMVDIHIRTRSFNLRRKLYFPERVLPPRNILLMPFRKIIDVAVDFTQYGHQMVVTCRKPLS